MKKVSRMPYNRTHRREAQVELEEFEAEMQRAERKAWLQFGVFLLALAIIIPAMMYFSLVVIPESIKATLGV